MKLPLLALSVCLALPATALLAKPNKEQLILFFGKDERVRVDPDSADWQPVGQLQTPSRLVCTGTLVSEDVVLTAGHCFINRKGKYEAATTFTVGLAGEEYTEQVKVREVEVSKTFLAGLDHRKDGTYIPKKIAGQDYAFVRLAQPLGKQRGVIPVFRGDAAALTQKLAAGQWLVTNGGYPLDDLTHLLAHKNCRSTGLLPDGRLTHRCDTLEGNSGSPILARIDGKLMLVAIQSSAPTVDRRQLEDNMAISSPTFYQQLQAFIHKR